jgi:hypothetical protein
MIYIAFIGNCQTISLCYFLQQLHLHNLDYIIKWCLYGDEFIPHLNSWSDKCKNKIINYDEAYSYVKICDIIIYQPISELKSPLFHHTNIVNIKKVNCLLVKIPSVLYFDYSNYNESLYKLRENESKYSYDVTASDIIESTPTIKMIYLHHPTTTYFLKLLKKICDFTSMDFFSTEDYTRLIQQNNIMQLPGDF